MSFVSTGGKAPRASLQEALFRGLAPDGGLYIPETLPSLHGEELREMGAAGRESWPLVATHLAATESAYVTGQTVHVNGGMAMI